MARSVWALMGPCTVPYSSFALQQSRQRGGRAQQHVKCRVQSTGGPLGAAARQAAGRAAGRQACDAAACPLPSPSHRHPDHRRLRDAGHQGAVVGLPDRPVDGIGSGHGCGQDGGHRSRRGMPVEWVCSRASGLGGLGRAAGVRGSRVCRGRWSSGASSGSLAMMPASWRLSMRSFQRGGMPQSL